MKLALVLVVLPQLALADVPDDGISRDGAAPGTAPVQVPLRHKDIVVTTQGERSTKTVAILASVAGAGALLGGVGVYFNLDSRSASDSVSAHSPTSTPWTPQRQAIYDQAHDSGVKAEIFYGLGAACVLGAAIGLIATVPGSETTVIHPHVTVQPGGATLGGTWSF
jgi:hypothetical protein